MKKKGLLLLCVLMACSTLVAGGKPDQTEGEPVKLVIAARGGSHVDVINAVKGDFEKANNCVIEVLGLEGADLKQKVALDSRNAKGAYDIMMIDDPWMPEFSAMGLLRNLTEAGYNEDSDFVNKSMDIGKYPYAQGDIFALPFSGNVTLLVTIQSTLCENKVCLTNNSIFDSYERIDVMLIGSTDIRHDDSK